MNVTDNINYIEKFWEDSILPSLQDFISIPNKSPMFDPQWKEHGHMDKAVSLLSQWCAQHAISGMVLKVLELPNRTPLIYIEIPGNSAETILMYGHLDKQPEMTGWNEDLSPWQPNRKGDRIYGRGAADDGYALFASLAAIKSLQAQNLPHDRCIILIEASEESGSPDLPHYIEKLKDDIGQPNLVICLDSGCGNYNQLWVTTSLRGLVGGILEINILKEGVHSGSGSGIVPSCFLVLRQLLNRIEDVSTGQIHLKELSVEVPDQRLQQIKNVTSALQQDIVSAYPFVKEAKPISENFLELILNRTWRPTLSVTGAEGLPKLENAGNVTLPWLKIKLSFRLAPTCDATFAAELIKNILEKDPPFGALINFKIEEKSSGWNAPIESPWLTKAAEEASAHYFGAKALYMGEGGSIPFMGMLGKKFPKAQFLITGVLGPESNAHGPNEFLHIPTAKKLTCCIAEIIAKHHQHQE